MSDLSRGVESVQDVVASSTCENAQPTFREGLPPSYRMRADSHYIDQLDAPPAISVQLIPVSAVEPGDEAPAPMPALVDSIKRHGVLEPLIVQKRDRRYRVIAGRKRLAAALSAGLREVPCIVRRVGDAEAQLLAEATRVTSAPAPASQPSTLNGLDVEVANSLAAVLSSTALLGDATPCLTRAVTVDMIRAEVQRAACTLRMATVLRHGVPEPRRLVSARDIIQRVADSVAADLRLRGIRVTIESNVAHSVVINIDPELLSAGLSAVVLALTAALNQVDDAALTLTARTDSGCVNLSVEQESVVVPETWMTAPTPSTVEGSGGRQLVPLLALHQIVGAYGGTLSTSRLPHGSRVAVELPTVSRR